MLNSCNVARMIDISAVRTHHSIEDIKTLIQYAKKYRFINVHVLPVWVSLVADLLKEEKDILVGSPVGFPSGGHSREIKVQEAKRLIIDGVQEMDMVINVGKLKSGEYNYVLDEIKEIVDISGSIPLKVIIEINCLTDSEIKKACKLVIKGGANYIKTGTGWIPGDANIKRIKMIKQFIGDDIKIKAAGGIRTKVEFLKLYEIGIRRFGINLKSAIKIVNLFNKYD